MFASIRKYNVRRGSAEHLARRVREGFVPIMRQMEGFRGYYLLDGGPDVLWPEISDLSDSQHMALCLGDAFLCWSRIARAAVCKRAWLATVPHSAAAAACH